MTPIERAKRFAKNEPVETQFVKDLAQLIKQTENDAYKRCRAICLEVSELRGMGEGPSIIAEKIGELEHP